MSIVAIGINQTYSRLVEIAIRYFDRHPEIHPLRDEDYCFTPVVIPIATYSNKSLLMVWRDGRMALDEIPEHFDHWHLGFEVRVCTFDNNRQLVDYDIVFNLDGDGIDGLVFENHVDNWQETVYEALSEIEIYNHDCPVLRQPIQKRLSPGYVYLLQSPTKAYKIGRSQNPDNRLKTFSVKLPFEVKYIALIETSDMVGLERQLHQRFADKRINGEWFELSTEDVQYIQGLSNE